MRVPLCWHPLQRRSTCPQWWCTFWSTHCAHFDSFRNDPCQCDNVAIVPPPSPTDDDCRRCLRALEFVFEQHISMIRVIAFFCQALQSPASLQGFRDKKRLRSGLAELYQCLIAVLHPTARVRRRDQGPCLQSWPQAFCRYIDCNLLEVQGTCGGYLLVARRSRVQETLHRIGVAYFLIDQARF
ncbi:hypothetical protein M011DRAFT_156690 [Sporormia fimetaria CBS 119925]|uniref:Uncharacterized protein n=1 Tax=Sporormia fimetaria CBS 119925 TaxID=1340428 RepID=A0A6A6V6C2_9PLEO|nr:hypothetical protein M011DRAFT_156690 [Sporormia fimetaria CBS 119925]